MFVKDVFAVLSLSVVSVSCALNPFYQNAERAGQMVKIQEMFRSQYPAVAPVQPTAIAETPNITEEELVNSLGKFPVSKGIHIVSERDGFSYDGVRYVDPEGVIVKYQYDTSSGDVTYLLRLSSDRYRAKFVRPGSNLEAVLIGSVIKSEDQWTFKSVTGKTLSGDNVLPSSRGIIIKRDDTAFYYTPGSTVQNITIPSGYRLADFQRGDVGKTGYILIEKLEDDGFMNGLKSLGATVGINKKEDYALFEYSTKKLVPINISVDGKKVSTYSDCTPGKKIGGVIATNKCNKMDSAESLWTAEGLKNTRHYFWLVDWQKGKKGVVAIVLEDGTRNLNAIDLANDKKVNLRNRLVGIYGFSTSQLADGTINVKDEVPLQQEEYADLEDLTSKKPAVTIN